MNTVYCYKNCSTCKKAIKWLDDNNIKYELKDIINDHPNELQMKQIILKSGKDINKFFNTSGLVYHDLELKDKLNSMSFDDKIKLLISNGMLIKRPLLVNENNILKGFKIEEWENLK